MFPGQTKSQLLWKYFILSWVFTLICSFVRLNICPFVHFIHLYICLHFKLSIFLFTHSVFSVFVHLSKCLFDCFFILLFVHLSVTTFLFDKISIQDLFCSSDSNRMTSSNLTQGLSDESSKRKIEDEIAVQTRVARSKKI